MTETSAQPAAAIYRGMDRAALDAAYNNGAAVADSPDWLARWQELSAAVRSGPRARLDIPYARRRRALTVLCERSGDFGFDRDRLFVGGWSAGGHLTAIVSDHRAFRGGVPISGIFDLEPIALNYLNEKLALDAGEIATLSPLRALRDRAPPLRMFVGSEELPELKRQSAIYHEAARQRALPVTLTVLPDRHHYSILDELAQPAGAITRALAELT